MKTANHFDTVDKWPAPNKMFAQWWRDVKVLSTFILQRFPTRTVAASISHHCANTNVSGQAVTTLTTTVKNEKIILDRINFTYNNFNINGTV